MVEVVIIAGRRHIRIACMTCGATVLVPLNRHSQPPLVPPKKNCLDCYEARVGAIKIGGSS
jgi:hypothetical protein